MIEVSNLTRQYELGGQVIRAVDNIDLKIEQGEAVALLGPSGSGKSTLMHLLGALDSPDSGTIKVGDQDVSNLSANEAAQYRGKNIGFVFQSFHLHPQLTAIENVALPLKLTGVPLKQRTQRAHDLLKKVGLGQRLDHRPSELSGGQQQRVSIARALANDPQILLADEPTGNLDSQTGRDVMDLFDKLHQETGMTLVVVTHDPDVAARIGKTVRVRDGKIESIEGEAKISPNSELKKQDFPINGTASQAVDLLTDIFVSFKRHPLRTVLTAVGIIIGALAITLMVGLGIGLQDFISTQAESINDPLSLSVTNSKFSFSDIVNDRAQQLGKVPTPLKEKALSRISKAREGFDSFDDEDIARIREVKGVESVRPRTFVVTDGVRLLPIGTKTSDSSSQSASTAKAEIEPDRVGPPEQFKETFYLGYSLIRGRKTKFRLATGRQFNDTDQRAVILSYQYADAWKLSPESLIGRDVEIIFPELGKYAQFSQANSKNLKAQYFGFKAKVIGLTKKSILSSVVFMPPSFGEAVAKKQFANGAEQSMDSMAMFSQLQNISSLAADEELHKSLNNGSKNAKKLSATLKRFAQMQSARQNEDQAAPAMNPMMLFMLVSEVRTLMQSEELATELEKGTKKQKQLLSILELLSPQSNKRSKKNTRRWGSRVRVRVESEALLPKVKAELTAKGFKVKSLQDNLATLSKVFFVINSLLSSFGAVALFVAAMGIANTLIMAVYERTAEIGVMKAVGATNTQIRVLFSVEAAVIGLLGGFVGVGFGFIAGELFNSFGVAIIASDWDGFRFFSAPPVLLFLTVIFCSLISFLAGLYPAQRAAALDPIVALRSD